MDELVRWLGEQLDEDERLIRDQRCINCGSAIIPIRSELGVTGYTHGANDTSASGESAWEGRRCPGSLLGATPVQSPDRVLREIHAKRQVIAKYATEVDRMKELASQIERLKADGRDTFMPAMDREVAIHRRDVLAEVLRLLALPDADRPGYLEKWRP